MAFNRHGLSRAIPSAVKRAVRQRCGFGCVSCGASIYEYDHFDPPFEDAREHQAIGIVLLCPTCHGLKDKGVLTNECIAEFNASPKARQNGRSTISLPHFKGVPALSLGGGVLIEKTPIPLQINDTPIVAFLPPERGSDVTRVSATITGKDGRSILRIVENEWIVDSGVWDFEWVGQRMTIRDEAGTTTFQLFIAPPFYIGIDRLMTTYQNWGVRVTETEATLGDMLIRNCKIAQFKIGIQLSSKAHRSWSENGSAIHIVEAVNPRPGTGLLPTAVH